jgi:hypothetical protein
MANAGNAQVRIPGIGASPLIVILATLCGLSAPARGQNPSPQILLEKALENARSITNIEIQYGDMLWIKGKPISAAESNDFTRTMKTSYPFSQDYTRTFHITYTASGEKYRTESRNESSQSTNIIKFFQTAFNASRHDFMFQGWKPRMETPPDTLFRFSGFGGLTGFFWFLGFGGAGLFLSLLAFFLDHWRSDLFTDAVGALVAARFGAGGGFASFLAFRLFCDRRNRNSRRGGAFHAHLQGGFDVGMEAEFHVVLAQCLDGMLQMDLLFVKNNVKLGLQLVGDHASRDGAEHLAVLASLDGNDGDELGNALGEFAHGIEFVGFALAAALAQSFNAALVGGSQRDGQALREKIIAGVTGGHFDQVGLASQAHDVLNKNDGCFWHKIEN